MANYTDDQERIRQAALEQALETAQNPQQPTYAGSFDQQLQDIYDKIQNREPFSYDVNADPLYQAYKDQYMQGGKLAMKDTMGQAAALTGGYGSTYGQQVGQQAYDAYLQKLGDVVPDLYSDAYARYADEGDRMLQEYSMLAQQRADEYGRYQDELAAWQQERAYQTQTQTQSYSQLYALIGSTGYQPTDEELAQAGMSREAADALRREFLRANGLDENGNPVPRYVYVPRPNDGNGNGDNGLTAEQYEEIQKNLRLSNVDYMANYVQGIPTATWESMSDEQYRQIMDQINRRLAAGSIPIPDRNTQFYDTIWNY